MNITNELMTLSARILTAEDPQERLALSAQMNALALQTFTADKDTTTGFLPFTKEEIAKMPKTFKKEFIINGCVAHMIRRPSGKNTYCYELRYRRNGYNITASSTDKHKAKTKFIEKLKVAIKTERPISPSFTSLNSVAQEWIMHKQGKVSKHQWQTYKAQYTTYISPLIGEIDITKIRTADLDEVMNGVKDKKRTAEDIRSIMNQVFNYARMNGIILHNPVALIPYERAEREHGTALSIDEERKLIRELNTDKLRKYRPAMLTMLFFGLRPAELLDAHFEDDFLIARNCKRKGGRIEYKKIPITASAARYIDTLAVVYPPCSLDTLRNVFHQIFPNHRMYDLRHTFSTRCQQFVRREIAEIWLGDSPTRLIGKTYTHFPDDFMQAEAKKIDYI